MGLGDSSVFLFSDGRMLTRVQLVSALHSALQETGINDSWFSGHSFRIGAATTAVLQGVPDSLIKTVSRWESAAYQLYIRTPTETLCGESRTVVWRFSVFVVLVYTAVVRSWFCGLWG